MEHSTSTIFPLLIRSHQSFLSLSYNRQISQFLLYKIRNVLTRRNYLSRKRSETDLRSGSAKPAQPAAEARASAERNGFVGRVDLASQCAEYG